MPSMTGLQNGSLKHRGLGKVKPTIDLAIAFAILKTTMNEPYIKVSLGDYHINELQ